MRTLVRMMMLIALCGETSAFAQGAPAAAAPAPAAAAPAAPAPAASAESPLAPETPPAAVPAPAPAPAAASTRSQEESRRALARARLRMQLDRTRAVQARRAQAAQEREPEPEQVRGDAGAAFAVGVSVDSSFYPDPSYDVYGDDDASGRLGLWLAYDVAALRTDTILAIELGYGHESDQEHVLGGLSTHLDTHVAHVGAQLRWVPLDVLQPHLRLAAGAALLDADLRESGIRYEDGSSGLFGGELFNSLVSPFASLGLGATLRTPTRLFEDSQGHLASLSAGFMLEAGYTLAAPVDIALDGPGPGDQGIALREPGLGQLKRSGPYIRGSLVMRF